MSWRRTAARYGSIVAVLVALLWLALALQLESFFNQIEPTPLPVAVKLSLVKSTSSSDAPRRPSGSW
jgi:hypothetical protein